MRNYFLYLGVLLVLNSCLVKSAIDQGPGILGACGETNLICDRNHSIEILDSISKLDAFKIPEEYQEFNNWDEGGFDFLTYWTISDKDNLFWISISDEDEMIVSISVRSVFDKKTRKWTHVKELSDKEIEKSENFMKWFAKKLSPCI